MSLGEGDRGSYAVPLLDTALDVYEKMSTFDEINVEQYVPLS